MRKYISLVIFIIFALSSNVYSHVQHYKDLKFLKYGLYFNDKLIGNQVSASSSNRNFKGRQGSPSGRTLLMSPAMVAAAAINGKVSDVRDFLNK